MVSTSSSPPRSGVWYFSQGWKLVSLPGIRRYVILPLLINIILMGGAFWWLFTRLESWIPSLMSHVPDWLQWLNYLLWPVAVISVLLVFGYFFSTIANWIAAPFNGLLAEQLEARLTGATPPDTAHAGDHERYPTHHEARMAEVCPVSSPRHCAAYPLFCPWRRSNGGPGAVVPVQRLDAGNPVLRLSVR